MFVLSFVLEDWAIHELVQSPRHRETALLLVASSYVTWTYQMHTFSNSIETLLVAWCLVLIQRIVADKVRTIRHIAALRQLIEDIAANVATCLEHSGVLGGLRGFQQDYFPSLLVYTRSSFDTPFREEVC